MSLETAGYILVGLIGALVAASEILSRYRDDPWSAVKSKSGLFYLVFNAAVSMGVFYLIRDVFPLRDIPRASQTPQHFFSDVFLAGAAAMAILRTSFLTVQVNGKDVQIGLAAVIDIFRTTIDRDVDRLRAGPRAQQVADIMKNISFERASTALTSTAMSLMQNVSAEEKAQVTQRVAALASQTDRTDEGKALDLGLILAGTVGFSNLHAAVNVTRDSITTATTRSAIVEDAIKRLSHEAVLMELPITCLSMSTELLPEDQGILREQIAGLVAENNLTERVKAINAALLLAHLVGEESFRSAVNLLESGKKPTVAQAKGAPVPAPTTSAPPT